MLAKSETGPAGEKQHWRTKEYFHIGKFAVFASWWWCSARLIKFLVACGCVTYNTPHGWVEMGWEVIKFKI